MTDGVGESVPLNSLPSPREAGAEGDIRPFRCTACLSAGIVRSKDRRGRSVDDESLTPPFRSSLSFSIPHRNLRDFRGLSLFVRDGRYNTGARSKGKWCERRSRSSWTRVGTTGMTSRFPAGRP